MLKKVSAIFGCGIDYLTGNADELGMLSIRAMEEDCTVEEMKLLKDFRVLPKKEKEHAISYVRYLAEKVDWN